MLVVVFAYAIHLRAPFDSTLLDFRTVVVLPSLYPIVAVAGAGRAAAAGPPGGGRGHARPSRSARWPRRPSASGWRATCTTRWPRPCTGSASPRWPFRGGSRSTRPELSTTPASWPQTPARRPRRRVSCSAACAAATTPSCRCRSRSAPRRRAGASAPARRSAASLDDVGPLPSLVAARAALDPQGGARQRRALRPRDARRRPPAPARRPRRADGRRRRRGLRGARRPRGARGDGLLRPARHARAGAARRRRAERRVRAWRRLRDLGLGPGGRAGAPAREPGASAELPPPSDTVREDAVEGFTWQ